MTRYVDPWTLPTDLHVGDRAVNAGGVVTEWTAQGGVPVCIPCDLAMTEYSADGGRCCPCCGAVFGEPLSVFWCAL